MFARYLQAGIAGAFMTSAVLWVMQSLISLEPTTGVTDRVRVELPWVRVVVDETTRTIEPLVTDWDPFERQPLPPAPPRAASDEQVIKIPANPAPPVLPSRQTPVSLNNGPVVAIVRIAPAYPAALQARGIEGFVTVQFDVLANGLVSNPRVVESSHAGFEGAALRALSKFRFKPRVVDGVPRDTIGLQNRFVFTMKD